MTTGPELIPLAEIEPIRGWEEFLQDGKGFLSTALAGYQKRQQVFTAEILYNIIAMAVEKFVMAALMRHGALPYNHTMADLVEAMETTFPGKWGQSGRVCLIWTDIRRYATLTGLKSARRAWRKFQGCLDWLTRYRPW